MKLLVGVGALLGAFVLRWLSGRMTSSYNDVTEYTEDYVAGHVPIHKDLQEFATQRFWNGMMEVTKVVDGVYVMQGLPYANIIVVEGPDGLIIIDTGPDVHVANEAKRRIPEISNKTVKAIVYTHFHGDHIQGVSAFIEDPDNPPDIWAHHTLPDIVKNNLLFGPRAHRGTVHQFGTALGSAQVWPLLSRGLRVQYPIFPNRLIYEESMEVTIAGLKVKFVHTPGETDDHIAVWLPEKSALMPGDNIYNMFPNLYAIRGTPSRDTVVWASSLLKLRSINAQHLVPSHGPVVSGQQNVYDWLTIYASAIQFVHDQTLRHMNQLHHPDEIARLIKLPQAILSHPYMGQHYGRVDWSAKGVYQRYIGWFSGDPVDLLPLTPNERSQRMIDLIGIDRLLDEAEVAVKVGDNQWALELSSHVFRVQPDNKRAKQLRLECLRSLAATQINAPARNFYLTAALDDHGLVNWKTDLSVIFQKLDIAVLLKLMKVQLKAELTEGVNSTLLLHFNDTGATFRLQVLYSVLHVDKLPDATTPPSGDAEQQITTTEKTWREILMGKLNPAVAYNQGLLSVNGDLLTVRQFLSYF